MPRQKANPDETNQSAIESKKVTAKETFVQTSPIVENVAMISRGKLPGIPAEITIRGIQRKDKKKMLMSSDPNILLSLLQSCIVAPESFNVYNLLPFETEYLLYRLRCLTYGSHYTFHIRCPFCGHVHDIDTDLSNIPILETPDNFSVIFDTPTLPVSGDVITCKLLNEGEIIAVNKKIEELRANTNAQGLEFDVPWEYRVVAINGQQLAPIQITQYLDNMSDYDNEFLTQYYESRDANYGLQKDISFNCDSCKSPVKDTIPPIYTFFRPTFTFDTTK